jgi:predicted transcriptional regulator
MTAIAHKSPMLPFSLRIREEQKDRLNNIAKAQDRTAHALAIKALDEYIERESARLEFKREAEASWQHFQETGLHVTSDEMDTWLEKLRTNPNAPMPVCHI